MDMKSALFLDLWPWGPKNTGWMLASKLAREICFNTCYLRKTQITFDQYSITTWKMKIVRATASICRRFNSMYIISSDICAMRWGATNHTWVPLTLNWVTSPFQGKGCLRIRMVMTQRSQSEALGKQATVIFPEMAQGSVSHSLFHVFHVHFQNCP